MRMMALVVAGLSILPGCAHTPPTVALADASLEGVTDSGRVLVLTFEAVNADERPFSLRDATCAVLIDGSEVGRVRRSPEATLRRLGRQTFSIPVAIAAERLPASTEAEFEVRGRVTYLVPGPLREILFDMDLVVPEAALTGRGVIDLRPPAAASLRSPTPAER